MASTDGTVRAFDPRTMEPTGRAAQVRGANGLAVGEDGVWVARAGGRVGDRLEVVRIDPRERELDGEPVPVPGAVPLDMAAAGGSVWITDAGGLPGSRPGGVSRLDPRARRLAGTLLTGDLPSAVAVGENGAWVTNAGDGTLTPISVGGR